MKRNRMIFLAMVTFLAAMAGWGVLIGSDAGGVLAQTSSDTYAIRNARIVTVTGPVIEKGTVVISKGKITAVGANVSVPQGATSIDAAGLSVYPGMIDAGSELGLTEIGSVAGSIDTAEIGDNNANIHVDVALHPDSSHIDVIPFTRVTAMCELSGCSATST